MPRRLPSLNALRAFEAAARHESFTLAAEELFVTHAAISRHVRELEDWLNTALFTRTGRGVVLTDTGKAYASRLTPLFDDMADATRETAGRGRQRLLKVSVEPSIASRWLIPRLGRFTRENPGIELMIDPDSRLVDFHAGETELAIRYGTGGWEGVDAQKLTEVDSFPVCSPGLIAGRSLSGPDDLRQFTLLHEEHKQDWSDWLRAAGVAGSEGWRGVMFQNHLAIEAAEAGQGFALGSTVLCADALAEGWLVAPFPLRLTDPKSYFIVRRKGAKESAPARAFREWLLAEMAEMRRRAKA